MGESRNQQEGERRRNNGDRARQNHSRGWRPWRLSYRTWEPSPTFTAGQAKPQGGSANHPQQQQQRAQLGLTAATAAAAGSAAAQVCGICAAKNRYEIDVNHLPAADPACLPEAPTVPVP
uniref:Uncharacterized protein n=1 Tax=Chromera velia CCMP2878 TaxID=1169474 RepID=A0A0G4H094_9ALVE|eukprot:Cvel_24179.t1-p1 / transcript=Cvel_24179.t1 / gene=Cvel_24179 / organism=Chromera_velia_CCMP2878 / gene_product=hypothetical protein / transcript_product=hypothetical protein / location=Cvel_scaffold2580:22918-23274(-) / protein_length=119 / sequence_SO=supercontig / SO=protein_coding / is_pseudo=false